MASLPSLADLADVEDRLGRDLTAEESRKADALLRDASTIVRNYCRRDFTAGTKTARYRPRGRKVVLPERPVTAVTVVKSVTSFNTTEMITPLAFWSWPGGYEVLLGDLTLVINGPTFDWSDTDVWVEVTYAYGFPAIPDDIITVVANMVVRNLTIPAGGVVDSETIGPYTTRYASSAIVGVMGIAEAERQLLNRYRASASMTLELRG